MKKRKRVHDDERDKQAADTLQLTSDEEDNNIALSQETEDLEQHTEIDKSKEEDLGNDSQVVSKKVVKQKLLKSNLTKHEKHLLKFRYCEECDNLQPPRSGHCHMCQQCVLKMDHHCVYMGNCIGFNNHKHFILMLFYLMIGSILEAT